MFVLHDCIFVKIYNEIFNYKKIPLIDRDLKTVTYLSNEHLSWANLTEIDLLLNKTAQDRSREYNGFDTNWESHEDTHSSLVTTKHIENTKYCVNDKNSYQMLVTDRSRIASLMDERLDITWPILDSMNISFLCENDRELKAGPEHSIRQSLPVSNLASCNLVFSGVLTFRTLAQCALLWFLVPLK